MKFRKSQQGMSFISWLVILGVVGFIASVAFKMIPHYMDYASIEKAIRAVETEPEREINSVSALYGHVARQFEVNGIRDLMPKDIMKVEQVNDGFVVHLDYERREQIANNLFLVAHFQKEYELRP